MVEKELSAIRRIHNIVKDLPTESAIRVLNFVGDALVGEQREKAFGPKQLELADPKVPLGGQLGIMGGRQQ